ncbi:MAG: hypothetical protein IJ815_00760 [Lachnospiraceae bacterium]|nr:hypothetical protein [Lachnospiraceae bacterium]
MPETKTSLKEHENKVAIVATLSEMNLERKSVKRKVKTKDGEFEKDMRIISGTIVGKLSETNSITIRTYASELTNSGSENKAFGHLGTLMENWNSVANSGSDSAIRFTCNADFSPTHYMGSNDNKMHEGVAQYRANFFTKVDDDRASKAEIKCDLYVSSVRPENGKDGEETGRWFIDGWISTYTGVEKSSFVVPTELANGISDYVHVGDTLEVYANVINTAKTETITKKMGIGADHVETKTTYKNELVITGATVLNDSENPADLERVFDKEAMTNAINEYKKQVESLQNGAGTERVTKSEPAGQKPLW